MTDISNIYLQAREHANAVSSLDWADLEGAGIDPGQALFETPVYDSIEERLEGDQMVKVGIGDENTMEEKVLSTRDATEQEKLYGGELSISNRGPETLREKFLYSTQDMLMEQFGMKAYDARMLSNKIFGGNPGDDEAPNLGIGLTDFLGLGEIFAIQEGTQQFKRGVETTGKMDAAIGGAVATASAIPFGVLAARMVRSNKAKELLQTAKERWERLGGNNTNVLTKPMSNDTDIMPQFTTSDGYRLFQQNDGTLTDHPNPKMADLTYSDLETFADEFGEMPRPVGPNEVADKSAKEFMDGYQGFMDDTPENLPEDVKIQRELNVQNRRAKMRQPVDGN